MISKKDEEKLKEKSLTPEQLAEIYEKTSDTLTTKYRGLDADVCKQLGVRWKYDSDGKVSEMWFPAYVKENGEHKITGFKVRKLPKEFYSVGYIGKCNLMGGMTDTIADTVILCGGENDMLTIKQELSKTITRSFNVVTSLVGESTTADMIRQNISYFEKHKKIILALDNDESGKEAQQACIDLLPKDRVYTANLRHKDANDYLKNREDAKTFAQDYYWNVSPVEDFGIIGSGSLFEYGLGIFKLSNSVDSVPCIWLSGLYSISLIKKLLSPSNFICTIAEGLDKPKSNRKMTNIVMNQILHLE